LNFSWK